jgi:hypothetical protein
VRGGGSAGSAVRACVAASPRLALPPGLRDAIGAGTSGRRAQFSARVPARDAPQVSVERIRQFDKLIEKLTDLIFTRPRSLRTRDDGGGINSAGGGLDGDRERAGGHWERGAAVGSARKPSGASAPKNGGGAAAAARGATAGGARAGGGGGGLRDKLRAKKEATKVMTAAFFARLGSERASAKLPAPAPAPRPRRGAGDATAGAAALVSDVDPLIPSCHESWPELQRTLLSYGNMAVYVWHLH